MDQNEKMSLLANSLKQARAVIHKADEISNGPGGASRTTTRKPITEDDVDVMLQPEEFLTETRAPQYQQQPQYQQPQYPQQQYMQPAPQRNLANSKMPAEILRSFSEMPAIDPTQPVGMELMMNEIVQKALPNTSKRQVINNNPVPMTQQRQVVTEAVPIVAPQLDTKLIEYIIRKTVEETLEQVSKKTAISENIQIKIGDKTFTGKITSLNEIKKQTKK
jgi:hypothetical protein